MDPSTLVERLAAHRTLKDVPRSELEWIAAVATEFTLEPGEVLTQSAGPVKGFYIVLDGHLSIRVDRGAGPRIVMEWHSGDVTGVLPYSRIKAPPGSVIAETPTQIVMVDRSEVPRMIRECPELTTVLVHVMLDRARVFKSSELLDEKMASLGRLAAGLAHELNNPASAVARSAKMLVQQIGALDDATRRFCGLSLSDAQCRAVEAMRAKSRGVRGILSTLDLADRHDALDDWIEANDVSNVDVTPLAESGFQPGDLDAVAGVVEKDQLGIVLAHVAAGQSVRQLVTEIDMAATRIHSLVAAVKGFTYVNQQAVLQPIDIGQGLTDTITVLRSKAKEKSVEVDAIVAPDLPVVEGYGGELNQVWANLIDNAIDATPGGHVHVIVHALPGKVVVRIKDDGPGIPPHIAGQIFDPFFTTKGIGQGTGLGLDIARRIVQRHHGAIDLSTGSDGTEFCVTLPAAGAPPIQVQSAS